MEFTSSVVSPDIMRLWTGISMMAAAVGKQVGVRLQGQILYPNMYILLVGPPGVGKSNAASMGQQIIAKTPIRLASEGVTKRAFIQELEEASTMNNTIGGSFLTRQAPLYVQAEEMGVFIHPADKEFMTAMARLYDCRPVFDYKTQHMGEHHIENAVVNLLGCCTRGYISDAWSKQVLEQGFPARIVTVYSETLVRRPLFDGVEVARGPEEEALFQALIHDMEIMCRLQGLFTWTPGARELAEKWYEGGMQPRPGDLRLQHYNNRRLAHCIKTAMIVSISKGDELVITEEDFVAAKELLITVEQSMPGAFAILGANPYTDEMSMAVKIVNLEYRKTGNAVPEYKIRQFLAREVPPQYVSAVIQNMVLANMVNAYGQPGQYTFTPRAKAEDPQEQKGE